MKRICKVCGRVMETANVAEELCDVCRRSREELKAYIFADIAKKTAHGLTVTEAYRVTLSNVRTALRHIGA